MRTIKFRGKDSELGWIYGDLRQRHGHFPSIVFTYPDADGKVAYCERCVVPETVGQFTGLLDKNGKEIYEGDLLQSPDILTIRLEVYYNEALGSFCLAEHTNTDGVTKGTESLGKMLHYYPNMEIIGNIHDTPVTSNLKFQILSCKPSSST